MQMTRKSFLIAFFLAVWPRVQALVTHMGIKVYLVFTRFILHKKLFLNIFQGYLKLLKGVIHW